MKSETIDFDNNDNDSTVSGLDEGCFVIDNVSCCIKIDHTHDNNATLTSICNDIQPVQKKMKIGHQGGNEFQTILKNPQKCHRPISNTLYDDDFFS